MLATGNWDSDTVREHFTTLTEASTKVNGKKTSKMAMEFLRLKMEPAMRDHLRTIEW